MGYLTNAQGYFLIKSFGIQSGFDGQFLHAALNGNAVDVDAAPVFRPHPSPLDVRDLIDVTGQLSRHKIHVNADEAYLYEPTHGKSSFHPIDDDTKTEIRKESTPAGHWNWRGEELEIPVTENLFAQQLTKLITEEQITELAYKISITTDDLYAWRSGQALPKSEQLVQRLAEKLDGITTQAMVLAYNQSVGGAIRHHLLKSLKTLISKIETLPTNYDLKTVGLSKQT